MRGKGSCDGLGYTVKKMATLVTIFEVISNMDKLTTWATRKVQTKLKCVGVTADEVEATQNKQGLHK